MLRRGSITTAAALVLFAAVLTPWSAPAGRADRGAFCAKRLTILFWPSGNKDLAELGEPAQPFAHLDLYRTFAATYTPENFLGWAAATKTPASTPSPYVAPNCVAYATARTATIEAPVTVKRAARLLCSLPRSVLIEITNIGTYRYRLRLFMSPSTLVAAATVGKAHSTLTYADNRCRRLASPS